ncbi:MAG: tetratricopeptide repeat protein [Bacteroidales bacterium]|nr:tetratricopeptide repeat protein [Bacteroidales bacterium]
MRMLKIFMIALMPALLFASCNSENKSKDEAASKEAQMQAINELEEELFTDIDGPVNKDSARLLIKRYVKFADDFSKEDSLASNYLFKAARIDIALEAHNAALKRLKRLEATYPESSYMPQVLIFRGTIYEDNLKDYNKAEKAYRRLMDEYPDSEFADDAEMLIKTLGKDLNEIIEEFEKQDTTVAS